MAKSFFEDFQLAMNAPTPAPVQVPQFPSAMEHTAPPPVEPNPQPSLAEQWNAVKNAPAPEPSPEPAPAPPPQPAQPQQPAVMQATRTTTEQGKPMSPELQAEQAKVFEQETAAANAQLDVDLAKAMTEQDLERVKQAKLADLQAKQDAERAAHDAAIKKRLDDFETAVADYKNSATIDPDRYKKKIGQGGRTRNAIALFFGTLGASLTRTPNYVAQAIDREIEAELRSQEAEIAKKKGAVDVAQNLVAFYRQKGLDLDAAHRAAKASLYEMAQAEANAELAKYKGPEALARHQQLTTMLQSRQIALRKQQEDDARGKVIYETTTQPVGGGSLGDQLKMRELEVDVPQPDGSVKTYYAKRKEDAIKVSDGIVAAKGIKQTLNEIESLVKSSRQSLSPAAREQVSKLTNHLRTQYGVLQGLGALSDKDYEIAGIVGNPESFFQRDATTQRLINQARKIADTGWLAALEGKGILRTNLVGR